MPDQIRISLGSAVAAADELIAAVRAVGSIQGHGDSSGLFMLAAFQQGFRRFLWIRNTAEAGAGNEASVLTRSLLNIVVRANWANQPTESSERKDRFGRLRRKEVDENLRQLRLLIESGFAVEAAQMEEAEGLADLWASRAPKQLPPDSQLFKDTKLLQFYARVYVPASGLMHFTPGSAMGGLVRVEETPLEEPDEALSAETLALAILVFAQLLQDSETTLRHGLEPVAAEVTRRLFSG